MTVATDNVKCRFQGQCADEGAGCLQCAENTGMASHFRPRGELERKPEAPAAKFYYFYPWKRYLN